jgi:uncharacterized protein (TIGR02391 family)
VALLSQDQLEAIAGALGHTEEGLTNTEIEFFFRSARMKDPGAMTKRHRLYNGFVDSQNSKRNRTHILQFIRQAMAPARYSREPHRYEPMRARLNAALAFAGIVVDDTGALRSAEKASTLPEAQRRARQLRRDLEGRGVHPDVLAFCRPELLADDYFHAVQEAVKSIAAKLRDKTGLSDDGNTLIDRALGGDRPMLAINAQKTVSERSEQSGFVNLVRGAFGMFRNPTAHEARMRWPMSKEDAEDILTIVSLIHRKLAASHVPPRA